MTTTMSDETRTVKDETSGFQPKGVEDLPKPAKTKKKGRRGAKALSIATGGLRKSAPGVVATVFVRGLTVLADWVLVIVTIFGLIPMLGAYIHEQSGAALNNISVEGTVAMWLVPFLFASVMLTVLELLVMRWLWRAGTTLIERARSRREGGEESADQQASAEKTAPEKKTTPAKAGATTRRSRSKKKRK